MSNIEGKLIYDLSSRFRNAIEEAKNTGQLFETPFNRFPNGCCADTSELLGQFLLLNGIHTQLVTNAFSQGQSHAWLLGEDGSLIIDITGDQFKNKSNFLNFNEPVYIGKDNKFYQLFDNERYTVKEVKLLSDMRYNETYRNRIKKLLEIILEFC
ncbi:hypothetical protein IGJ55_000127 [Enterococcus sp. AZ170]|uniref:hypothetical protein n=1 Tax=unclassified Enterococcus TaxID=2608891 RepID=UPI003D2BE8F4